MTSCFFLCSATSSIETKLHVAIDHQDLHTINKLLKTTNQKLLKRLVSSTDTLTGQTVLQKAILKKDLDIVQLLLQAGSSANETYDEVSMNNIMYFFHPFPCLKL